MGAMPSRAQSEFYKGLLPIELSDDAPAVFTADLKNDRFANRQPPDGEEISRPLARVLVPFCIGVAATLTWQSYRDAGGALTARSESAKHHLLQFSLRSRYRGALPPRLTPAFV